MRKPLLLFILFLSFKLSAIAQTTYDFSVAPVFIDYPNVPQWKQIAEVTIGDDVYHIKNMGNDTWALASSGGFGNGSSLVYSPSSTATVEISRKDKAEFTFYGVWLDYQNYTDPNFYPPPYLTVSYGGSSVPQDIHPAPNTQLTLSKNTVVTSVTLTFTGLSRLNFDNLIVGPAADPAPVITGNPVNKTICNSGNTSFSVSASNASSYQWQVNTGLGFLPIVNGGVYSGATSTTLYITGANGDMSGSQYRCVVKGSDNSAVTSSSGRLIVASAPVITSQPAAASVSIGGTTTFSVTATDATSYQWQVNQGSGFVNVSNSSLYSGATTSALAIPAASAGMNGYLYRCLVAGLCTPDASSNPAALSVLPPELPANELTFNGTSQYVTIPNNSALEFTTGTIEMWVKPDWTAGTKGANPALISERSGATRYSFHINDRLDAIGLYNNGPYNAIQHTFVKGQWYHIAFVMSTSNTQIYINGISIGSTGNGLNNIVKGLPVKIGASETSGAELFKGSIDEVRIWNRARTATEIKADMSRSVSPSSANLIAYYKIDEGVTGNGNALPKTLKDYSNSGFNGTMVNYWSPNANLANLVLSGGSISPAFNQANLTYTATVRNSTTSISLTPTVADPKASVTVNGSTEASGIAATVNLNEGINQIAVLVTAEDGTQKTYSLSVTRNKIPTAIILSSTAINENGPVNSTVGTFSSVDADPNESFVYTLVNGEGAADNQAFNIAGNVLRLNSPADYELKKSYAVRVRTTDRAGDFFENAFTITINDQDENPVFTSTPVTNAKVGVAYSYRLAASDPFNKTLSIQAKTTLPSWLTLGNGGSVKEIGGSITAPGAIAEDASGNLYVSAFTGTDIYKITPDGTQTIFATRTAGETWSMLVHNGFLYFTNWNRANVSKIDLANPAAGEVTVASGISSPSGMAIYQGSLYVSAYGASKVVKVNLTDGSTSDYVSLTNPTGIGFDKNGILYISQMNLNKVSRYDGTSLQEVISVIRPTGVVADQTGAVFVSTRSNVLKYSADYTSSSVVGTGTVWSVALTSAGKLIFANFNNGKTYKLDDGAELSGTPAIGDIGTYPVSITASNAAESVDQSFTITVTGPATLSNFANLTKSYGDAPFALTAPASTSNGTLTYTSSDPQVASISGGTVTILKPGTTTITASQAASGNYTEAFITATLTVAPKDLTVSLTSSPLITKVYDGNTAIVLSAANYKLNGKVGSDDVAVAGIASFDTKDVGTDKTITVNSFVLAGAQKDRYNLLALSETVPGSISKKELTLELNALPVITKVYDGTVNATLSAGNYSLVGVEESDEVTVSGTANFDSKDAGEEKTVTVADLILAGSQRENYKLVTTRKTTLGSVTRKAVTVAMNANPVIAKVYDGTTQATLADANYTLEGIETGDLVSVSGTARYMNKDAGTGKTVLVDQFVLAGAQKDNYTLTTTTTKTSGLITSKEITLALNASPAITKVYNGNAEASLAAGNYTLHAVEEGDEVTVSGTATYDTKHVGTDKKVTAGQFILSGAQKDNYTLTTTTATTTGSITQKAITLSLEASPLITKVYDGTTAASLSPGNYVLNDLVTDDVVTVSGTAKYDTREAAAGKTVTVSGFVLAGAQKDNYTLTTASATTSGTITKKELTVALNAIPAISKVYDGNRSAALAEGNYILSGVEEGDVVNISGTGTYDSKGAGLNKTVTVDQFVVAGAQKDNYSLGTHSATTTGVVTPKRVTASAAPIVKTYDGTDKATVSFNDLKTESGLVAGDDVSVVYTSASYDSKHVGTGKPVTVEEMSLAGAEKDNYLLNSFSVAGTIHAKAVTVTADARNKTYGGQDPVLTFAVTSGSLASGDNFTGALTRTAGEAVGSYAVNQGTLALSSDYALTFAAGSLVIGKKDLTISADNKEKFVGTPNPVFTVNYDGFVNGEDASVLVEQPVASTTATTASPLGTYPITVSGASATNYAVAYQEGTLLVRPGAPTSIALATETVFENLPEGTLAGTLSSTSDDPNATFTYSLADGAGDADNKKFVIAGDRILTGARLNFEQRQSYKVRIKSTTQHGFSLEKEFTVTIQDVNEIPTLSAIADQTICFTTNRQKVSLSGISAGEDKGQSVVLTVISDNAGLFNELEVAGNEVRYRVKNAAGGIATVTVMVTDNGGKENGGVDTFSRTFAIAVNALPVVSITSDKGDELSKGLEANLTATGGVTYVWANAHGIIGGQNTATLTVRPAETTTYRVRVTNASGCSSEREFTVRVSDDYSVLEANNILTPNGDGMNDRFKIKNIDMYPKNEVKIYDRAGRLLYSQKNYTDEWDGTLNGSPLAEDTYFYVVDFGQGVTPRKGFITIVRE